MITAADVSPCRNCGSVNRHLYEGDSIGISEGSLAEAKSTQFNGKWITIYISAVVFGFFLSLPFDSAWETILSVFLTLIAGYAGFQAIKALIKTTTLINDNRKQR
jgi:hypothetical protein